MLTTASATGGLVKKAKKTIEWLKEVLDWGIRLYDSYEIVKVIVELLK